MLFTAALTGLMATAAMAAPYRRQTTSTGQNVVYWGQNGGGTIENNDLSTYCTAEAGIDIVGMYIVILPSASVEPQGFGRRH